MKFSLFYPVAVAGAAELGSGLHGLDRDRYRTTVAELREQAVLADETGWTSLLLAEHHFEVEGYQVTPNPLLLNVYLAQHTSRLRHGQMGLVLPTWNPLRLAEDVAMADHLTGGRLDVAAAPQTVRVVDVATTSRSTRGRPRACWPPWSRRATPAGRRDAATPSARSRCRWRSTGWRGCAGPRPRPWPGSAGRPASWCC